MYDVLHECDRWYKQIHGLVESELLPFNISLEANLNFRMIKNGQDHHFDEGEIVLRNFGFDESHKKTRQTYRFTKQDQRGKHIDDTFSRPLATYDNKRSSGRTDRISFLNSSASQTTIKQMTYRILEERDGPSDHLPVYSTFDIEDIDGGKKDYVLIRHPVRFKWRQQTYKNSNKSYQKGVHCNT